MIFSVALLYGNYSNTTTIPQLFSIAGEVFPLFWILTLIAIFVIGVFTLKQYETMKAVVSSAFLTSIISIIMYVLGWVGDYVVYACVVGLGISLLALIITKDYY